MSEMLALLNDTLVQAFDDAKRDGLPPPNISGQLLETFITRNDARNYMLLGDPAAQPQIWAKDG